MIIHRMRRSNIDIYLVQETWLEGKGEIFKQLQIYDYTVFLHGNEDVTCSRGRGGVGIFLSKRAMKAWTNAGSHKPDLSGVVAECPRFMGMKLLFKEPGNKPTKLYVSTTYHPHSGMHRQLTEEYYQHFDDFLDKAPKDYQTIVGGDTNTPLGTATDDDDLRILGKYGAPLTRNDDSTAALKNTMLKHQLRAPTTDFKHKRYDTWSGIGKWGGRHQIDYFLTSTSFPRKNILDAKRVGNGIDSDHAAIKLKLRINPSTKTLPRKRPIAKPKPDWSRFKENGKEVSFRMKVDQALSECNTEIDITTLNNAIMNAACATIPRKEKKRPDWFSREEKVLESYIDDRNRAYNEFSKNSECTQLQEKLRTARHRLRTAVKSAKNAWTEEVAKKTTSGGFHEAPKDAWKAIRTIQASTTGHHAPSTSMKMRTPTGKLAENDRENMEALAPHFENIFNGQSPDVDIQSILDDIEQRPIFHELGLPPTLEDIEVSIADMANDKAPGASGVNANALKNLSASAVKTLHQILVNAYNGIDDPEEWHIANLKSLFKKGDSSDPSNWRGICLKDMTARIMSATLNKRLLKILAEHGVETQYGSQKARGCQDGLFVLRSALETRRQHDLPTWALFVDLVKAFDTVNHELLFALLERYGAPKTLADAVRRMYTDMHVKLQVGKEEHDIPYTVGVQQGDNMAPILFLFVMQAFSETLEDKWEKEWGLTKPTYRFHRSKRVKEHGRLLAQNHKAKGTLFEILYLLYVDDGTFLFDSREALERGANRIYEHFARFGLKMHIGHAEGKSKTEAMYISPSLKEDKEKLLEPNLEPRIPVHDGFITLTEDFRYLGSIISNNLRDELEITTRIKKATAQIGALRAFFRCPHIQLSTKYRVFVAIPVNTALWGCDSWALTEKMKNKLRVFYHKSIRSILNINMHEVEAYRITNEQVRKRFLHIPDIIDIIHCRQLKWIGKVARMGEERAPRRLIASWCNSARKPGKPQFTYRNAYAEAIGKIIPDLPQDARLQEWIHVAKEEKAWNTAIANWWATVTHNPFLNEPEDRPEETS